jgi:hypothetical protein
MNTSNGTKMWVMQTQQIKIKRRERPDRASGRATRATGTLIFDHEEKEK